MCGEALSNVSQVRRLRSKVKVISLICEVLRVQSLTLRQTDRAEKVTKLLGEVSRHRAYNFMATLAADGCFPRGTSLNSKQSGIFKPRFLVTSRELAAPDTKHVVCSLVAYLT